MLNNIDDTSRGEWEGQRQEQGDQNIHNSAEKKRLIMLQEAVMEHTQELQLQNY